MANNITPMTINGIDADVNNDFSWQGDKYTYKTGVTTETENEYGNIEIEEEIYTFSSKDHGHGSFDDIVPDVPIEGEEWPVYSPWTGERTTYHMRSLTPILWACDPIDHGHPEYLKTLQIGGVSQFGEIQIVSLSPGINITLDETEKEISLSSARTVPAGLNITGVKNQNYSTYSGVHIVTSGTNMTVNDSEMLIFVEETKRI